MPLSYQHLSNILSILWGILLIYWLVTAFNTKKAAYRQNWYARILYTIILIALFEILFDHHWMLGGALLANALTTQIVGIILSGAGIAFAIWARFVLGKNWSGIPSIKEGHELIQSGPYAIVRHPIYTGIILSALGDAIAFGFRVEYIAIVFALFVSFWVKLQSEEKLMMKQFPEKYPEYKEKVRGAIIPSVL